jgi:hypothetical protein
MFDFENAEAFADKALLIAPENSLAQKVSAKIKEFHQNYLQGWDPK